MNPQNLKFGAILCLVAMLSFISWPLWQWLSVKQASVALAQRTTAIVEAHPELQTAHAIALLDGTLTWEEAKAIIEGAGETVGEDE